MEKKRFIAIRNQADTNTLELFFLDVIEEKFDWFDGFTSPVQEVIDKVNFYKPSTIRCIIDSVGGDATKGMAIYNFLKRCDAKVEVEIIGLAASMASVIAMAANKGKLRIAKNAFMMIHKAEGSVWGTADEIRKGADVVEMYTEQIVDIYSQRTGKPTDEIKKLIEGGDFWMSGADAVEMGFADVTFNETPNLQIAARLDPKVFESLPANIRAQMGSQKHDDKTFFQNQFDDMKKFFTDIVNAIKGVKPGDKPEDVAKMPEQIANAVQAPFEKLGDEIETMTTNTVSEQINKEEFVTKIANKVKETVTVPKVDFTADGDAKTSLENAVKVAVENAVKPYQKKIDDLESEITTIKGGASTEDPKNEGKGFQSKGKWK